MRRINNYNIVCLGHHEKNNLSYVIQQALESYRMFYDEVLDRTIISVHQTTSQLNHLLAELRNEGMEILRIDR